jgi:hypothetical protein
VRRPSGHFIPLYSSSVARNSLSDRWWCFTFILLRLWA